MIGLIIKKRIRIIAKRRGVLVARFAIPLIVAVPLLVFPVSVFFIAKVMTFMAVLFGVFGVEQSIGEDRARGALRKMAVAPIAPATIVFGEVLANAIVVMTQLAPLMIALMAMAPGGAGWAMVAYIVAFAYSIIFTSALGALLIPLLPETRAMVFPPAIFALLVFSGVLVPLRSAIQIAIAKALPPAYLYQATLLLFGKEAIFSLGEIVILGIFPMMAVLVMVELVAKKIIR